MKRIQYISIHSHRPNPTWMIPIQIGFLIIGLTLIAHGTLFSSDASKPLAKPIVSGE